MNVAADIIIIWPGTNASIPAGYSRHTDYDSRYLLGAAASANPGTTGGQSSHNHESPAHTHTQNSHTHSIQTTATTDLGRSAGFGTNRYATTTHSHGSSTSAAATATNQDTTITVDNTSNDPPYYEVIFIKSDGTKKIPNNAVVLFDSATLPSNWNECDGAAGRPDLRGKFLKGAATSGDSGGTGGSLNNHTHTTQPHTHVQNAHTHASANSAVNTGSLLANGTLTANASLNGHRHPISLGSQTATNQNATVTMNSVDGRPPFLKLMAIQNNTGGESLPPGIIAFWPNSIASIPAHWILCDGQNGTQDMRDKFLEVANGSGQIGATGGADQHSHTADAHTHTQDSHNHSASSGAITSIGNSDTLGLSTISDMGHTHTWSVSSVAAVNQNTTVTINNNSSKSNYPPYTTVLFIKLREVEYLDTIQAKARIERTLAKTIQAKARVERTELKTVQAKGRVEKTEAKTTQAKARIERTLAKTIQAKARVERTELKTVQAKGRVEKTEAKTTQAKARIEKTSLKTIQAKARIRKTSLQTIQAKAAIQSGPTTNLKTVQARARIGKYGIIKTVQAKANIWAFRAGFVQMRSYDQSRPNTLDNSDYAELLSVEFTNLNNDEIKTI